MTYGSFICIVRHICKSQNIVFSSKTKYYESKYDIHYYIFYKCFVEVLSDDDFDGDDEDYINNDKITDGGEPVNTDTQNHTYTDADTDADTNADTNAVL